MIQSNGLEMEVLMNTIQLECFIAVAEVLNFSKAAEMLNITQPAVSHQINSLENELDTKLFIRDSKSVEISESGIQFLPDALKIIEISKSSKARLKNSNFPHLKPFEICCHSQFEMDLLPPVLSKMKEEFPYLLPIVRFVPAQSAEIFLENESIQVMFGYKASTTPIEGKYKELSKFPISSVFLSDSFPEFNEKTVLSAKDLHGYLLLMHPLKAPYPIQKMQASLLTAQNDMDHSDIYFHYCDSYESIMTLVRSGFGIAINIDIPATHDPTLTYKPIQDLSQISFGLYYKSSKKNPELTRFIELMTQLF